MDLSYEESVDYDRFFDGGEMPENATIVVRPVLLTLRTMSSGCTFSRWGRESGVGILFVLGRLLYKYNRVVEAPKKVIGQEKKNMRKADSNRIRE